MTVEEKIIQELKDFPGLDDDELASRLSNDRHYINDRCNTLAKKGIILREKNHLKNGKYCNYILKNDLPSQAQSHSNSLDHAELQEEDVKHIINNWLISNGWETTVAWGCSHGVDIEANRNGEHWLIEVKGPGSRNEMRVNYFIGILGETLQRMDDETAHYSIAFPDIDQFRRLWSKLPTLAKQRTTIDMILVCKDGSIEIIK